MKKIFISIIFFVMMFSLFACKKAGDENVFIETKKSEEYIESNIEYIVEQPFLNNNSLNIFSSEIYVLKNQSEGQILSIVINNKCENNIIVFDGGREEDADFLVKFLKELNGGFVNNWFITHCHDDHVGALYKIMDTYKDDILIGNIYYNFPTFEWLYDRVGVDAGAVTLVENRIKEYSEYVKDKEYQYINGEVYRYGEVIDDIKKGKVGYGKDISTNPAPYVSVEVMNDRYLIDEDPINNSSIVYKIEMLSKVINNEPTENITMIVLGDLSYEGGKKLLEERGDDLKSDICVLAHHGQGGVWEDVYEAINPDICIWPTTKKIYENKDGKYHTDEVKKWFEEIGVKKHYTTVDTNIVLK